MLHAGNGLETNLPPILRLEKAAGRFCDILGSKTLLLSRVRRAEVKKNYEESSRWPGEVRAGQLSSGLEVEQSICDYR